MKTYDYIIVGAGSAGCVLANRLSAENAASVLLLEAGQPDKKSEINVPMAFSKLFKTSYDWAFHTEPQPCAADRELYWPRGKTLGGSSSINAMIYIRGNRQDFDDWQAAGNIGWGYKDVLPFFKRLESHPLGPNNYHGAKGPLSVEARRYTNPLSHAFVEAAQEAGLAYNEDFNAAEQEGAGLFHVTQKGGARHSAATAYLKPVLQRPNLTVLTGAHVHQVNFEGDKAVGVTFRQDAQELQKARADTAVILSAGAVQSPQLLMLSGIGAPEKLKGLVDVKLELPGVGENLWDHLALPLVYESLKSVSLDAANTPLNIGRYLLTKRGPLSSNVGEAGGFMRTQPKLSAPDLQFHFGPAYFVNHGFSKRGGHHFTVAPTLVAPASRGVISLASADPEAPPRIDPRYLCEKVDADVLVRGVELARTIAEQPAFMPFKGDEVLPGANVKTRADLDAYVRTSADTIYHPAGTCKMGHDELAVVDDKLKVHGVQNLYVADASVMPNVVRGNTNAASIMIGEKAAELLKQRL